MPAEPKYSKDELRIMLEAEEIRAAKELQRIKLVWLIAGVALLLATVLWLFFGGREQFVSRDSGYDATVLIPAWLALIGIIAATIAAVLFMMRAMRASLGNIVERDVRAHQRRTGRRK